MFNFSLSSNKNQLSNEILYDLIIVGSGPAGLSSAIYAARKGLSVGIIGDKPGGQVNDTSSVENYIGFEFVTGEGLAEAFKKHAESLEIHMANDVLVKSIEKDDVFKLIANNYMTYQSKTVLIATGSKSRQLGVPGEKEFYGKGVTYCAICDGPLFKEKTVVIAGGGNSAVEAAIDLSKIANKVYVVHRSEFRADKILVDKLYQLPNVEILLKTQIKEILGDGLVNSIQTTGELDGNLLTDGVLVEIGYVPNSQFADVEKNQRGEIIIDDHHMTSISGIFAAGDVTTEPYKQIVVAASEGAKAALAINEYINNL
ncbi:MAG: FAD-dependent oxidoreductase [Clostridia bacterium]|nr:FAD-dependent oxidoreductase [Clostridia bacterium]